MSLPAIAPPHTRIPAQMYLDLRTWLIANDPDAAELLAWSKAPPPDPEKLASEVIWIILCAGRSAQAARTIERKVWRAIQAGEPVVNAFGYRAKAAAIERAWRERETDFLALQAVLATGDIDRLVAWCKAIPFVGDDTQYQLAKNFGGACCKPDRWLARLAGIADSPRRPLRERFPACMDLCRYLAGISGDSIPNVDSLLWLACNKGVLVVDAMGGPVSLNPLVSRSRSIYTSAPETVA